MFEAKRILDADWLKAYENDITALWLQLVQLNTNLFILEKIIKFNFNLFGSGSNTFWVFVIQSLLESCIMCSWRIAIDTDSDCLTVAKLKNAILGKVTYPEALKHLKSELKKVAFDKRLKEVSQKIRDVRHKRYAHLNREIARAVASSGHVPNVPIQDLKIVRDTLNELIQVLGFDTQYAFLTIDYNPSVKHPNGVDPRPDIVQILDDIASKNEILHLPERQPEVWKLRRNEYNEVMINEINTYRKKLGLPEA